MNEAFKGNDCFIVGELCNDGVDEFYVITTPVDFPEFEHLDYNSEGDNIYKLTIEQYHLLMKKYKEYTIEW